MELIEKNLKQSIKIQPDFILRIANLDPINGGYQVEKKEVKGYIDLNFKLNYVINEI